MAVFAEEGVGCSGLLGFLAAATFVFVGSVALLASLGSFFGGIVIVTTFFVFTQLSASLAFNFLYFNVFVVLPLALFVFMFFGLVSFVEVLRLGSYSAVLFFVVFPVRRNC